MVPKVHLYNELECGGVSLGCGGGQSGQNFGEGGGQIGQKMGIFLGLTQNFEF